MKDWERRHEEAKRRVRNAPSGTPEYLINAAIILSQHAGPGMRAETRAKLEALARSDVPEARRIVRDALCGIRKNEEMNRDRKFRR